jgi:hypothetical protein
LRQFIYILVLLIELCRIPTHASCWASRRPSLYYVQYVYTITVIITIIQYYLFYSFVFENTHTVRYFQKTYSQNSAATSKVNRVTIRVICRRDIMLCQRYNSVVQLCANSTFSFFFHFFFFSVTPRFIDTVRLGY